MLLIDVREPSELEAGKIEGAVNIPREWFVELLFSDVAVGKVECAFRMNDEDFRKTYGVPKPRKSDSHIVFCCFLGVRGMKALKTVKRLGYNGCVQGFCFSFIFSARNLEGGYRAWKERSNQRL